MKIKKVSAKNFRTLLDFEMEPESNYCAISGQNNAGKTCVIRVIQNFLYDSDANPLIRRETGIKHLTDSTQWGVGESIELSISLEIGKENDAEIYYFLDKFAAAELQEEVVVLTVGQSIPKEGAADVTCQINGQQLDFKTSSEIAKKLKTSNTLEVHNSTSVDDPFRYLSPGTVSLSQATISEADKKALETAETTLKKRIRKVATGQKQDLSDLLVLRFV